MRRAFFAVFAVALLLPGAAGFSWGELEPKEEKSRLKRLKSRANDYLKECKTSVVRCRRCNGAGHKVRIIAGTGGRQTRTETCDACMGHGRYISESHYLRLHYHLKSPAFRAQRNQLRHLEQEVEQLQRSGPPERVTRTVLKKVEMHGDRHGVAWSKFNREKTYSPTRWIWIVNPAGTSGEWYLYDETVDGEWRELTEPGSESGAPKPLEDEELKLLRAVLEGAHLDHGLGMAGKYGRRLYLEMSSSGIEVGDLQSSAAEDATKISRAIWGKGIGWACIHWTFNATWRNAFGETETKPYLRAEIEKSVFDRIVWKNLTTGEAFRVFHPQPLRHEGWELWQ